MIYARLDNCKIAKIWQLQLQVSNICHVNNIFRTRCCTIVTYRAIDLKLGLNIQCRVMHMSEMSNFLKFKLQVAILCNLKIFTCWPIETLHNGPSTRLVKLIKSSMIGFKLRKNSIYDVNGIPMQILPQDVVWF